MTYNLKQREYHVYFVKFLKLNKTKANSGSIKKKGNSLALGSMITQRSQRQQSTPAASSLFHFHLRTRTQGPQKTKNRKTIQPPFIPFSPAALHLRRLPALRSYSTPGGVAASRRPNPRRSRRAHHASGAISRHHAGLPRRRPRSAAAPGHHARHRAGLLPHPGPIPQPTPSLKSLNSMCSVLLALCSRCPGVVRFGERARTCACLDCAHAVDDLPRLCRFYCTLMVCLGDLIECVWRALLISASLCIW